MSDAKASKRQLTIKTGVVKRLTKEEKSYVKESEDQEARVARYESEGKDEWEVKKQREVLQDCRQMIPDCRKRLQIAAEDLQSIVDNLVDEAADSDEARAAKEALQLAGSSTL
ncbi:hypothetical protein CBS101457_000594 [Exobasidium rhododendri]|nr:hypothetical protein CBS101457_000594 [Exobasidium rhododendri]